jgi:hypothetical protein
MIDSIVLRLAETHLAEKKHGLFLNMRVYQKAEIYQ